MNPADQFLLAGLIIILIPSFYYAHKKNFFAIYSEKFNNFPIQLLFTIPVFSGLSFVISILTYLFAIILFPSGVDLMVTYFGSHIGLSLPIISNILIIFIFNKFIIEKKNEQFQHNENELFIYFPVQAYHNFGGKFYGTKFTYPKRKKGDLLIGVQESNLIIKSQELKNIDFAFTFNGEIVVSEKSLQILNEHELTGFQTRPIQDYKSSDSIPFFQIIPIHTMPEMERDTKTIYELWIYASKIIVNDEIYYNKTILPEITDFNQSFESFGYESNLPYPPQKYWIVSKKARSVLINELGQQDYDFIPVHLVNDE